MPGLSYINVLFLVNENAKAWERLVLVRTYVLHLYCFRVVFAFPCAGSYKYVGYFSSIMHPLFLLQIYSLFFFSFVIHCLVAWYAHELKPNEAPRCVLKVKIIGGVDYT